MSLKGNPFLETISKLSMCQVTNEETEARIAHRRNQLFDEVWYLETKPLVGSGSRTVLTLFKIRILISGSNSKILRPESLDGILV